MTKKAKAKIHMLAGYVGAGLVSAAGTAMALLEHPGVERWLAVTVIVLGGLVGAVHYGRHQGGGHER